MNAHLLTVLGFSWIIPLLAIIIFYKQTLRVFFGMIIIPEDKVGIVTKKWVLFGSKKTLPDGKIIAMEGEAGYQADSLAPGIYFKYWIWQYSIECISFIAIPQGKIGLIVAKDGSELPMGHILAKRVECDNFQDSKKFLTSGGQRGKQVAYLNTGLYRINTALFTVATVDIISIQDDEVGIVTALDGEPLHQNQIAGIMVDDHNNFQDFDKFLTNNGQRGLQIQTILAGSYSLNPWAVNVEKIQMTQIPIGYVGVVISYVGNEGKDLSGEKFKHGNIVSKNEKGVWNNVLDPGKYPINIHVMKVELVPTTNLVLNWANSKNEAHNLDKNLCTITVRSQDGFTFNLDVAQIIHVPSYEAPKVIARFGNMQNLVGQILEPSIGNYFRNSAQDSDVIAFLNTRQERQEAAKVKIAGVLTEYNITAVDTLIGDIVPPAELMKTLTDRKIASEQQETYSVQMNAQKIKQSLESERVLADMQAEIVSAQQSVNIAEKKAEATVKAAEGDAKSYEIKASAQAKGKKMTAEADATQISLTGKAEAEKIQAIGKANAEAYEKQTTAMGKDNFAKFKIVEVIGQNNVKIIPDVLIGGGDNGSNGPISGLLGMELLNMIKQNKEELKKEDIKKEDTKK